MDSVWNISIVTYTKIVVDKLNLILLIVGLVILFLQLIHFQLHQ